MDVVVDKKVRVKFAVNLLRGYESHQKRSWLFNRVTTSSDGGEYNVIRNAYELCES